ncbi:hypothetical protein GW17_00050034 [Ensete ventricosum]|nr:hypothetical protein GW17_00050034 [Ensete ventricosum]
MSGIRRLGALAARSLARRVFAPPHMHHRSFGAAALAEVEYWTEWEEDEERGRYAAAAATDACGEREPRRVQWVFMGSPGVQRHVYATRVAELLDVPYISMGSLVRQELNPSSSLYKKASKRRRSKPGSAALAGIHRLGALAARSLARRVFTPPPMHRRSSAPLLWRSKVFCFELQHPIRVVRIGPTGYRYVDLPLPGGTVEIGVSPHRDEATPRLLARDEVKLDEAPPPSPHETRRRLLSPCRNEATPRLPAGEARENEVSPRSVAVSLLRTIMFLQIKLLEEYYTKQKKLLDVQVTGGPGETWQGLLAALHLQHMDTASSQKLTV